MLDTPDVEWPAWVEVSAALDLAAMPDVLRTQFEDGAIRQARRWSTPWLEERIVAHVPPTRVEEWRAWVRLYGGAPFVFRSAHDARLRAMRIRNGAGGVSLRQVRRSPGPSVWEASLTVEGPDVPISAPNLWSDDVALGHDTHVYARSTVLAHIEIPGPGPLRRGNLTPSPVLALDPVFFAAGTAAVWINGMILVRAGATPRDTNIRLRFSTDPAAGTTDQALGPDILTAALPGLTHVIQILPARPLLIPGGTGGGDLTDPYAWTPAPAGPLNDLFAAWQAAGSIDRRQDPPTITGSQSLVRWALVWSGAGSVVDLAAFRTAGGGAAPVIASG